MRSLYFFNVGIYFYSVPSDHCLCYIQLFECCIFFLFIYKRETEAERQRNTGTESNRDRKSKRGQRVKEENYQPLVMYEKILDLNKHLKIIRRKFEHWMFDTIIVKF